MNRLCRNSTPLMEKKLENDMLAGFIQWLLGSKVSRS